MCCDRDECRNEMSLLNDELIYAQSEIDTLLDENADLLSRVKELVELLRKCNNLAKHGHAYKLVTLTSEFAE